MALAVRGQVKSLPREDVIEVPVIGKRLCVHNLFQSNMVVQRDKPIVVWGWADPGEIVTVSFGGNEQEATAGQDRSWKVTLPSMPADSEAQKMTISGKTERLTLDNVLVGDVWVVGGQSNMQHPLSRVEDGQLEIVSANFPEIRLLTVPAMIDNKEKKNFPRLYRWEGNRHEREGDWDVCSPDTVREFSAIGYVFGRRLHMASRAPIGLIDASRWGTTVEAWTPLTVLKAMDSEVVRAQLAEWEEKVTGWDAQRDLDQRIERYNQRMADLKKQGKSPAGNPPSDLRPGPETNQNYPGNCYASMIAPIAGFAVKGAIYHQGFNNSRADAATFYYQVFPGMISAWRAAFSDPTMAFGIISLCTDGTPQTLDNYDECMMNFGIYVREAQYKTFLDLYRAGDGNIGFASSFNLRRAWYHPQQKIPAGERIARWALATQYGFGDSVHWKPPMVMETELRDGKILLHLDNEVGSEDSQAIAGFAISGSDRKFQPARAECLVIGTDSRNRPRLDRKVLLLSSPYVPNPVHFRYAWGRNPMGNLRAFHTNRRDVAFATQRSDDWEYWEVAHLEPPADKDTPPPSQEEVREVLRFIDLERRIRDAEQVLETDKQRYEESRKTLR